jgi:tRNA(Arg) A34 adenosine deaminase TadA
MSAPLRDGEFSDDDERFMRQALVEAEGALHRWEVPVGCVVVRDGAVVAAGSNRTNELRNVRPSPPSPEPF